MLEASRAGSMLMRNNSGVAQIEDNNGGTRYVRYGLCNESAKMNKIYKSADLIGVTSVLITPEMVGQTLGVFTAVETKRGGWRYTGKGREVAQDRFLSQMRNYGAYGGFASSAEEFKELIQKR